VARYNATPAEGIFFNSPLGIIGQFINSDNFILRKLPPVQPGKIFIPLQVICTVRGGKEQGRRPYVNYKNARYTSKVMSHLGGLVGKKIKLEIDTEDLTHCQAYLMDGSSLGMVEAQGHWGWTKHSLRTRNIINSLAYKRQLFLSSTTDPVLAYMELKSQVINKKSKKNIISPKDATEATRLAKETGLPRKLVASKPSPKEEEIKLQSLMSNSASPRRLMTPMPNLNELLKKNKN
jgi:putative transposase